MDPFHDHSSVIPGASRSPRGARPGPQSGRDRQDQGPLPGSSNGVAAGKGGSGQENASESRGTSEAAEGERIELERVLNTMVRQLDGAKNSITGCKKMCASVPLDSLPVSTLKNLAGLVNAIEDASENVSEEAAGLYRLIETMRKTASARVERPFNQRWNSSKKWERGRASPGSSKTAVLYPPLLCLLASKAERDSKRAWIDRFARGTE